MAGLNLCLGQTVYFKRSNRRYEAPLEELTVTKIGRQYAYLTRGYRVHKDHDWVDGGDHCSPGRVFLSPDDYHRKVVVGEAWRRLRVAVDRRYEAPDGVTLEAIESALYGLGLEPKT